MTHYAEQRTKPSWPTSRSLFHGAVRESLAAVNSAAAIGIQDTHAWERPVRYVADDNQGNVGVVEFLPAGVVAAISARAPEAEIDCMRAVERAPVELRDKLLAVCALPLLQEGLGITAIFWSDGDRVMGPVNWDDLQRLGADLFRRELMPDTLWAHTGAAHYALSADVAHLAISAAARAVVDAPMLRLSEGELRLLVPRGSDYEDEALDLLLSEGLFVIGDDK